MDGGKQPSRAIGVNQAGVRNHNERLVLTLISRGDGLAGSDIARLTGLSAQTVSVILRKLEKDELVIRGAPVRGKVGKPSTPMTLNPAGAYSVGLKLGRRSADLVLIDICGEEIANFSQTYRFPTPKAVLDFIRDGLRSFEVQIGRAAASRMSGIGIARPSEVWSWAETLGVPGEALDRWKEIDIGDAIAEFSDLPVLEENDMTAACRAEHVYGLGAGESDFGYFFVGSFIGGGLVLNGAVHEGFSRNAGAFGSIPAVGPDGKTCQLIDVASLIGLERRLVASGRDPEVQMVASDDWAGFEPHLGEWISEAAVQIARAAVAVAAVVDIPTIIIDGAFPDWVRARLAEAVSREMAGQDTRGMTLPNIIEGSIGADARAFGAASAPIFDRYLLHGGLGRTGLGPARA